MHFRGRTTWSRVWAAAALAAGLAGCGGEGTVAPEGSIGSPDVAATVSAPASHRETDLGTCDSLAVPTGQRRIATLYARGDQIYRWDGGAWVFVAPSARLYPNQHARGQVGVHYAGPTWESLGGSKVVGSVVRRCSASPSAIPWLLLSAASSEGHGLFRGVSYIQRLHTQGGLAPTTAGSTVGETVNVPYTADYVFYRAR